MRLTRSRAINWLDDQVWWHQLRCHDMRGPVMKIHNVWRYWAHTCETCDYTWIR